MIKEAQSSVASAPKSSAPKKTAIVPAAEPAGPRTVRITGLDSGPVEVPLASKK
jgi:hypothetical protein